jgi:hypothetical protein
MTLGVALISSYTRSSHSSYQRSCNHESVLLALIVRHKESIGESRAKDQAVRISWNETKEVPELTLLAAHN